jgi:hypothetical protein
MAVASAAVALPYLACAVRLVVKLAASVTAKKDCRAREVFFMILTR